MQLKTRFNNLCEEITDIEEHIANDTVKVIKVRKNSKISKISCLSLSVIPRSAIAYIGNWVLNEAFVLFTTVVFSSKYSNSSLNEVLLKLIRLYFTGL